MGYTITKEYLARDKVVTDNRIMELNNKLENYETKIKSKINSLIVQHAALICDYEAQESKKVVSSNMKIITRKEAMAQGLKRYYTGLPCVNGHYSFRYTRNAVCNTCVNGETDAKAKRDKLDSMQIFKVRLVLNEHQKYLKAILDMTNVDNPDFTLNDVLVSKKPTHIAGGTGLFKIRAYPHHGQLLKNISDRSFTGL